LIGAYEKPPAMPEDIYFSLYAVVKCSDSERWYPLIGYGYYEMPVLPINLANNRPSESDYQYLR
ncbi:hypothetical protein, partial [Yersinia pestis]